MPDRDQDTNTDTTRRSFLLGSQLLLSGAAISLLAGTSTRAFAGRGRGRAQAQDITILNTAIAAEHEAVAAYALGASSGLLSSATAKVAVAFQGHHKEHIEALAKAVEQLGGIPADARKEYAFPVAELTDEAAVLQFAAKLERGAVSAYAGAIPLFDNRDLSLAAASILADEAMHWAVLRGALGLDPVPGAFFK